MSIRRFNDEENIKTEATILNIKKEPLENIPHLTLVGNKLVYRLSERDKVYGLGENVRGLNKRGWVYESYCSDDPSHTQDKVSLYGAHNFLLIDGEESIGIFIDAAGRVKYDVGFTNNEILEITLEEDKIDLYIIEEVTVNKVVQEFRALIGKSYVPPKWAFGYQQSRWSYADENEVLEMAELFKEKDIPLEAIYLDIDYMERFKNFTIDKDKFKNFEVMVEKLKKDNIKAVPIIDAGVKIEKGYETYEEGIKNNYFCNDIDGKPFVAAVWPGVVHFPDFLNKDARLWFGKKCKFLVDKGIEGFWNDMNEPAIFYSEKRLQEAYKYIEGTKNKNLDIYSFFKLKDSILGLSNNIDDYKSFYHNIDGEKVQHNKIHNLYGYNMTKSAAEGLDSIDENKRFLLFSRASSIGMHRYGGIWTGDNNSLWEHLEMNIKMMPNLNICGYMYTGADTGGFGGHCTEDLLTRWMEFSIFTPLLRNHSAMGTRRQEPFAFNEKTEKNIKNIIKFRYRLIPYLYSEYMKAIENNDMLFKPLSFVYDDEISREIEDQLIVGDSIMIAPIYKQNAKGRYVYLPEEMAMIKIKDGNVFEEKIMSKGHHYIEIKLDEFIIFVRQDKILPLANKANKVNDIKLDKLEVVSFIKNEGKYELYDDDGISKAYLKGINNKLVVALDKELKNISIQGDIKVKELKIIAINKNVIKKNMVLEE